MKLFFFAAVIALNLVLAFATRRPLDVVLAEEKYISVLEPIDVDNVCPPGKIGSKFYKPEFHVYFLGKHWVEGPTWDCDNRVCRGAMPYCQDETARTWACFCINPNAKADGDRCVLRCPFYP
jgi:hypothetical protein